MCTQLSLHRNRHRLYHRSHSSGLSSIRNVSIAMTAVMIISLGAISLTTTTHWQNAYNGDIREMTVFDTPTTTTTSSSSAILNNRTTATSTFNVSDDGGGGGAYLNRTSLHDVWEELVQQSVSLLKKNHEGGGGDNNNDSVLPETRRIIRHANQLHHQPTPMNHEDITVAVHADVKKLSRLLFLCHRWGGPVSAAIYIRRRQELDSLIDFYNTNIRRFLLLQQQRQEEEEEEEEEEGMKKQSLSIHILMETGDMEYPHNRLRQLALDGVPTKYFLALDVDFVPSPGPNCHDHFQNLLRTDPLFKLALDREDTFFVLPAFNQEVPFYNKSTIPDPNPSNNVTRRDAQEEEEEGENQFLVRHVLSTSTLLQENQTNAIPYLPNSREEAIRLVHRKQQPPSGMGGNSTDKNSTILTEFHIDRFFPGHGPTNYSKWYSYGDNNNNRYIHSDFQPGNNSNGKKIDTNTKNDDDDLIASSSSASSSSFYYIDYQFRYEPYVLGYKNLRRLPKYFVGFRGFGYNKLSWFVEAHYCHYQFAVLRDFFVVHLHHEDITTRRVGSTTTTTNASVVTTTTTTGTAKQLFNNRTFQKMIRFKQYLLKTYPDRVTNEDLHKIDPMRETRVVDIPSQRKKRNRRKKRRIRQQQQQHQQQLQRRASRRR